MKKIFLLLVAGFVFYSSIVLAAPSILFDDEVYDFGDVVQGESLEHVFTFTNEGDETLVIEKVTAS